MVGTIARAVFFVLLPAFGVGGALGLPILLCLAGALSLSPSLLRQAVECRPWSLLLLAGFLALAVTSSLWSEHAAGPQALKIGALAALGSVFAAAAAQDRRLTRAGAVAAFAVLAALLAIEAMGGLPLNRAAQPGGDIDELTRNVTRAASLLLALTWAAAGALLGRSEPIWKAGAVAILAAGGFVSLQFGQFANTVGFVAGLAAFAGAYIAPRIMLAAVFAALLVWLIGAPFITPLLASAIGAEQLPFSWSARIEIWSYICDRIWEQPWFGHGLDAARAHLPAVPVHPHSASLQIWFELGAVGVALAGALLVFGGRSLLRNFGDNRPAAAATAGTLAAAGVVANLSFNLWAEWWLAAMFVAAGVAGALARSPR
ncbi:MAG TPA: O-antigen ligase family protein [Candidatus Binatia bacterium]|nr:O-antigen ligase family protein [Candidatus Binatia bacterium]